MSASKSKLTKGVAVMLSIAAGLIGVIVFSFLLVFGARDKAAAAALGERPYWHFLAAAAGVFAVTGGGILVTLLTYLKGRTKKKAKEEETAEITSPAHQPDQPQEKSAS
ncbi:MAG: hypothetical protein ACRD2Q_00310 [Terriglobales bacterium]